MKKWQRRTGDVEVKLRGNMAMQKKKSSGEQR